MLAACNVCVFTNIPVVSFQLYYSNDLSNRKGEVIFVLAGVLVDCLDFEWRGGHVCQFSRRCPKSSDRVKRAGRKQSQCDEVCYVGDLRIRVDAMPARLAGRFQLRFTNFPVDRLCGSALPLS